MNAPSQRTPKHPVRRVLWTWLALIALMLASLGSSYLSLGAGNAVAGLLIAAAKSALVAVVFMSLGRTLRLARIAALLGLCLLALLIGLGAVDDATRDVVPAPMQTPRQVPPLLADPSESRR